MQRILCILHFDQGMLLILVLVEHLLGFLIEGAFFPLVNVAAALLDDSLQLRELALQLKDIFLNGLLVLFKEFVASTLKLEDVVDLCDDAVSLLYFIVAAAACLQVLVFDRFEVVVIDYALLIESFAE